MCFVLVQGYYSSVSSAQLRPTLCDPTDFSMPGLPVHHQLPELAQTHVHQIDDAIQPSLCCRLLLLPSIIPSLVVFSSVSVLCIRWPEYWSFSFSISLSNEYSGLKIITVSTILTHVHTKHIHFFYLLDFTDYLLQQKVVGMYNQRASQVAPW